MSVMKLVFILVLDKFCTCVFVCVCVCVCVRARRVSSL
jgi:hypothetical protein